MAAIFGAPRSTSMQERKRPLTYGKTPRNATYGSAKGKSLFEASPKKQARFAPGLKRTAEGTLPSPKAFRSHLPPKDDFEVPPSDDEEQGHAPGRNSNGAAHDAGDEYDVPLSDEDWSLPTVNKSPRKQASRTAVGAKALKQARPTFQTMVDLSSRKRKRPTPSATVVRETAQHSASDNSTALTASVPRETRQRRQEPLVSSASQRSPARRPSKKAISAPARLHEMVGEARPQPAPAASFVAELLEPLCGKQSESPSTPKPIKSPNMPKLVRSVSVTPKQRDLWSQLLPSDPVEPVHDGERAITEKHRSVRKVNQTSAVSSSSVADASRPRVRLIDRLKQERRPSIYDEEAEGEDSGDDDTAESDGTVRTAGDAQPGLRKNLSKMTDSQFDSQNSQTAASGSRNTYAQTRSYLQEDNFEDNLLFAMPMETPAAPAAATGVSNADSGSDEGQIQAIRSIHELRAAGSKKRFMDDVEILLGDIQAHGKSERSRRRSALMDLASKLAEKAFTARFVDAGYDESLTHELRFVAKANTPDIVADTIMLVVLVRLLNADLSRHSMNSFRESEGMEWMFRYLSHNASMSQQAKDRKNNMSKASQTDFLEFVERVRLSGVWDGVSPKTMTIGVLALKCLDAVVMKLRKLGHKDAILKSPQDIELLTRLTVESAPTTEDCRARSSLALSILEAESLSVAVNLESSLWPISALESIAAGLPSLIASAPDSARTTPIALRLCLDLTNNKPAACNAFAKEPTIFALLSRIISSFSNLNNQSTSSSDGQAQPIDLDILLLSLGLAYNLAEYSHLVRTLLASHLPQDLVALVTFFLQGQEAAHQAESLEQSRTNVAYGYLAVLLATLCLDREAKKLIRDMLPGKDMGVLVRAVEEFVLFHQQVDRLAFVDSEDGRAVRDEVKPAKDEDGKDDKEGQEIWKGFTNRLMAVARRIGDGRGNEDL